MKQRSFLKKASLSGKSLHTGQEVHLMLKPAPVDHGITFRRTDLYGKPEIKPDVDLVDNLVRSTDISSGYTKVHTIEHILSALRGCGIDNAIIEMDASEPPIMDGSARPFVQLIQKAEPVEQEKERQFFKVEEAVSVSEGNRSLIALPYDGFKITCTSADDRGIHTQHYSVDIDPEVFIAEIAPARTFAIYEEIEELLQLCKIRGGSLDSAVVIKGNKIVSKEPLRFKEEFVRHKILDIIGDMVLLGKPLKAHIVAVRPGHSLNAKLAKALRDQNSKPQKKPTKKQSESEKSKVNPEETKLNIQRVLDILPHRYPFVLIDRIIEITEGETLTAIKNVTFNEPYFNGHFPGNPVMPGVLQLEAMAQAAGALMLRFISSEGKLAFFMSCDKVKFRRPVIPGDQIEIFVKIKKHRGSRIALAEGVCKVDDKVVSSAELLFSILDNPENN